LAVIEQRGLNVRQTEALVRQMQSEPEERASSAEPLSPQDRDAVDKFQQCLGTKVNLVRGKKGGRLVIHFYSEEELQAIYEAIVGDE
jgi:ParB family chromosome partitioning protein